MRIVCSAFRTHCILNPTIRFPFAYEEVYLIKMLSPLFLERVWNPLYKLNDQRFAPSLRLRSRQVGFKPSIAHDKLWFSFLFFAFHQLLQSLPHSTHCFFSRNLNTLYFLLNRAGNRLRRGSLYLLECFRCTIDSIPEKKRSRNGLRCTFHGREKG